MQIDTAIKRRQMLRTLITVNKREVKRSIIIYRGVFMCLCLSYSISWMRAIRTRCGRGLLRPNLLHTAYIHMYIYLRVCLRHTAAQLSLCLFYLSFSPTLPLFCYPHIVVHNNRASLCTKWPGGCIIESIGYFFLFFILFGRSSHMSSSLRALPHHHSRSLPLPLSNCFQSVAAKSNKIHPNWLVWGVACPLFYTWRATSRHHRTAAKKKKKINAFVPLSLFLIDLLSFIITIFSPILLKVTMPSWFHNLVLTQQNASPVTGNVVWERRTESSKKATGKRKWTRRDRFEEREREKGRMSHWRAC